MSLKERDRLAFFRQVKEHRMTLLEASARLGISYRQAKRLWRRFRDHGDVGLVHGLRGRPSNNQTKKSEERRKSVLELYQGRYAGVGPTLAAERMAIEDGVTVNHETLRGWLSAAGLWHACRQPRRRYRRRERRARFGELVQLDGSDHAWFGPDRPRCVLMVMIDDATSVLYARFFEAETTYASMTVFKGWVERYGLPCALYPDCHAIYRRNDKQADEIEHRTGNRPLTRFGEAMVDLGVNLICAHSPQAKGRVERANGTLQDRLVHLMRLAGITDIEPGNAYLEQTFLAAHNAKFMVPAADEANAHVSLPSAATLEAALCPERDRRVVDKTGCVNWRGRCFELLGADAAPRRRREVLVRERLDGQVELVGLDGGRVLQSRERPASRPAEASDRRSLTERVAAHAPPSKPAATHPWRSPIAVGGSATARCARLRSAAHRDPEKGTLLLG